MKMGELGRSPSRFIIEGGKAELWLGIRRPGPPGLSVLKCLCGEENSLARSRSRSVRAACAEEGIIADLCRADAQPVRHHQQRLAHPLRSRCVMCHGHERETFDEPASLALRPARLRGIARAVASGAAGAPSGAPGRRSRARRRAVASRGAEAPSARRASTTVD